MKRKIECPECGEETFERLWAGLQPQVCSNCGHETKEAPKLEY